MTRGRFLAASASGAAHARERRPNARFICVDDRNALPLAGEDGHRLYKLGTITITP